MPTRASQASGEGEGGTVAQMGELLDRLTGALSTRDREQPLSSRLCDAYRELSGADGAAITVHYETTNRVTLCTTNPVAHRLEDLQDVLGEGPGHAASTSGQIETCSVPAAGELRQLEAEAQVYGDILTLFIINSDPVSPEDARERLEAALAGRAVIEQAKGVLAEQRNLDMSDAYVHLLELGREAGEPLTEVARSLILAAQDPGSRRVNR